MDSEIVVPSDAERQILEILDRNRQLPGGEIFKHTKRISYNYILRYSVWCTRVMWPPLLSRMEMWIGKSISIS